MKLREIFSPGTKKEISQNFPLELRKNFRSTQLNHLSLQLKNPSPAKRDILLAFSLSSSYSLKPISLRRNIHVSPSPLRGTKGCILDPKALNLFPSIVKQATEALLNTIKDLQLVLLYIPELSHQWVMTLP